MIDFKPKIQEERLRHSMEMERLENLIKQEESKHLKILNDIYSECEQVNGGHVDNHMMFYGCCENCGMVDYA